MDKNFAIHIPAKTNEELKAELQTVSKILTCIVMYQQRCDSSIGGRSNRAKLSEWHSKGREWVETHKVFVGEKKVFVGEKKVFVGEKKKLNDDKKLIPC